MTLHRQQWCRALSEPEVAGSNPARPIMGEYTFLWSNTHLMMVAENNPWSFRDVKTLGSLSTGTFGFVEQRRIHSFQHNDGLLKQHEAGKKFLDAAFAASWFAEVEEVLAQHRAFYQELWAVDMEEASDQELLDLLSQINEYWRVTISYFRVSQAEWTKALVEMLFKRLATHDVVGLEAQNLLSVLSTPDELDAINKEELALIQLCCKKEVSDEHIIAHLEHYPWIFANRFTLQEWIDEFQARLATVKAEGDTALKKRAAEMILNKKELHKEQESLYQRFDDPELEHCGRTLARHGLTRVMIKELWAGEFYWVKLQEELVKRTGVDAETLFFCYREKEIKELLLNKKKLSEEEIARRKEVFVFRFDGKEIAFYSGKEARELAEANIGDYLHPDKDMELKGQPASPGKVQGRAIVVSINDPADEQRVRKKFRKGDILVSQMTQPGMMDLVAKAAGIVTDEGGIVSHAAIVSREFKIPCVVGTHLATKVIKEGDMIEVDADEGIVRKT